MIRTTRVSICYIGGDIFPPLCLGRVNPKAIKKHPSVVLVETLMSEGQFIGEINSVLALKIHIYKPK